MAAAHSEATIISMDVVATGITVLLHEGVWARRHFLGKGRVPTELTNHLTSLYEARYGPQ